MFDYEGIGAFEIIILIVFLILLLGGIFPGAVKVLTGGDPLNAILFYGYKEVDIQCLMDFRDDDW